MQHEFSIQSNDFQLQVIQLYNEFSDEQLSILTSIELESYNAMVSSSRKNEFVTSRILLKSMLHNEYFPIIYDGNGRPFMQAVQLSLSHSKKYAAAIISKECNVGIDIEQYRESILKIAFRFMTKQEEIDFKGIHDITLLWSAKEVLYKMFNASPDFQEHFSVSKIEGNMETGKLLGRVKTNTFDKIIELSYFRNLDFCLVWAFEKI